ncbi:3-carboxy-cis,cis-muconate cycloisomerase [Streptomyces triticagri]|uniref:3-carboxy-cis,cis-muconate cycloisomerase n=1 Tax=Streptomyces triticagri TaxID=2293568 RepID=A0A372M0K8_9ACTN|nr:lyase family protein [Streptomyces triticagri]RFU84411.1 3-carboxy-cis,cis-muconate cycloisomerase [Streptomyces triticagri]
MSTHAPRPEPFSLTSRLAADPDQCALFCEDATLDSWLATERALARAQAEAGVLTHAEAAAIRDAARLHHIDREELWRTARTVGYPILGLVRQISRRLPPGPDGRLHYGATTQDIMDTGLALQMVRSLAALECRIVELGDVLADRVTEHAATVMAARTHGQQAVPTTFGATLAGLLAQFTRHRQRLAQAAPRIGMISLFGAGGTAAAFGPHAAAIRRDTARLLGLHDTATPWHVARDGFAEFGWLCSLLTATCARLARNIVDLSRTEIAEVFEPYDDHRGASSTMPQKVNPITSESIIGLSGSAGALTSALLRAQEAGHERAAGEWHIEWRVLPELAVSAGAALTETIALLRGLRVDARRMRTNLGSDRGLVMAESHMIALAGPVGRERAHDLVHEAVTRTRTTGAHLTQALRDVLAERHLDTLLPGLHTQPENYLGQAHRIAETTVRLWRTQTAPLPEPPTPLTQLVAD